MSHLQGRAAQRQKDSGRRQAEADPQKHAEADQARKELNEEASRLEIKGRSNMGKDELRRAIARAR